MPEFVCYVLARNDLQSMNPGKLAAQVHHCGVQMMAKYPREQIVKNYIEQGISQGADSFNTTIVLAANCEKIQNIIKIAKKLGIVCDLLVDPTYPATCSPEIANLLDPLKVSRYIGNSVSVPFVRKELTCAWLLIDKMNLEHRTLVEALPLYD